ncbi:hypothetical protein [Fictibacillus phosphorivorans]|uniref:hypothetical protein n=1 Tax=Fictibacillus phosphorivorans TaxID=1221500 RepID=UPI0012935605|nr:hypothetical protein [Fictibacillus phosphorivorans]MQR93634.1 hypothetical protein [Fictibacillus phosphorivorans]
MIINKVIIGNSKEAFIENSFSDNFNIISSDDNNKGKTILIQSIMYCLGNSPTFPSTFDYQDYYHIVEFTVGNKIYYLCRKKDSFILKSDSKLMLFESISELKRYWSKNIFRLPSIIKNGIQRIVDPELFFQLFFVGQDKKDTANIANRGFYNKDDFYNMLYSFAELGEAGLPPDKISIVRREIRDLKDEKNTLLKQHKILRSTKKSASFLSSVNDKISFKAKISQIDKIKNQILDLRKTRNAALSRKSKCEVTLKELNSLNRTISGGELRCMDCNSTHIGFSASIESSYTFDVSTPEIRSQIISSIIEKIASYQEDIDRYTIEINNCQVEMESLLSSEEITLEVLIAFKQDLYNASDAEARIKEIDGKIKSLEDSISVSLNISDHLLKKQHQLLKDIVSNMNFIYKQIDPLGNLVFNSLFTKRNQVFSGSEATEFHLVKLISLAKVFKYNLPLVVDSFRAEDLSTEKEEVVLKLFSELGLQIIFTTTLKTEELGKYKNQPFINNIDYSSHKPSKILNPSYLPEFKQLISKLAITNLEPKKTNK